MALLDLVLQIGIVVIALNLVAALVVVGRHRLFSAPIRTVRSNLNAVATTAVVLVAILAINRYVRDAGVEISWIIGLNITGYIYLLEGHLVAHVQSLATPVLTAYFDFVYVFGYVFLLTFPILAYLLHDDARQLNVLLSTYAVNYAVGVLCYVLFVAYGPRNFMPELVEPLLYTSWPEAQRLTTQVNRNTNVFPSLHTSLSVSVAILAYRFRAVYPRWLPIAGVLAGSIAVSTMYLGIHWAVDVLAGLVVAVVSVAVASRVDETAMQGRSRRTTDFLREYGHRTLQKLR